MNKSNIQNKSKAHSISKTSQDSLNLSVTNLNKRSTLTKSGAEQ